MFVSNIHLLRGLAILMIVLFHVDSLFIWINKEYLDVIKVFLRDSTAIFLFIAGYLFQYLSNGYNIKEYYIKKLKYVVFPYLVMSIPAIILFTFFQDKLGLPESFEQYSSFEKIIMFYFTGKHVEAFWFIPVMLVFYLAGPVLYKLDKNKTFYWFLPVFVVISLLVPRNDNSLLQMFMHFFSIYFLGMFVSKYREWIDIKLQQNKVLLLLLILLVLVSYIQHITYEYFSITILQKMVFCIFMLSLFHNVSNTQYLYKVLALFGTTSFGVFFIHSYVIFINKVLFLKFFGGLPTGSILGMLSVAFFVLVSSMLFVIITRKVFGKNSRFLIGS